MQAPLTDRQNHLSDDTINAVACLKSSRKAALQHTVELDRLEAMLEGLEKYRVMKN